MAKPALTQPMRRQIVALSLEFQDRHGDNNGARTYAKEVRNAFRRWFEEQYPETAKEFEHFPKLNTVEKVLAKTKGESRQRLEPGLEDRFWTVDALAAYPLPPETLSAVLKVWDYVFGQMPLDPEQLANLDPLARDRWSPLTIRQARWVSQLCYVLDNPADLYRYAKRLSFQERAAQAFPLSFDLDDYRTDEVLYLSAEVRGKEKRKEA